MRFDPTRCSVCGCAEYSAGQLELSGLRPTFWARCPQCGVLWERGALLEWPHTRYTEDGGVVPPGAVYDPNEPKIARVLAGIPADSPQWELYDHVIGLLPPGLRRGTMLEVGCGAGEVLDRARSAGHFRRVVGMEIGRDFVLCCRSRGHEIHYLDVTTAAPVPSLAGDCDFILCNEVMEHVTDPLGFVRGIRSSNAHKPGAE